MQKRHRHALELGVNPNTGIEQIMENCSIVIIASVEPDQPWSKSRLNDLEADLEDRFMTLVKGSHTFLSLYKLGSFGSVDLTPLM